MPETQPMTDKIPAVTTDDLVAKPDERAVFNAAVHAHDHGISLERLIALVCAGWLYAEI